MANKLMYFPNDAIQNNPFCRLKLVVETLRHSTKRINQSKFTQVPKVVKPTVIIKLRVYCNKQPIVSSLSLSGYNRNLAFKGNAISATCE